MILPPAVPGTYVLVLRLDTGTTLTAGRLGTFDLPAGLYAYVGSAHGPGGLRARLGRHLRRDKPRHWHIDWLTALATPVAVWARATPDRLECAWARALGALPGCTGPIPRFGASDCSCQTHLFAMPDELLPAMWAALGCPDAIHYT